MNSQINDNNLRTLTYPNGDMYSGMMKNGKPHVKGILKYSNCDLEQEIRILL